MNRRIVATALPDSAISTRRAIVCAPLPSPRNHDDAQWRQETKTPLDRGLDRSRSPRSDGDDACAYSAGSRDHRIHMRGTSPGNSAREHCDDQHRHGSSKPRGARTIASNQWRSVPRETPVALCRRVPADHLSPSVVGRARLGLVNDPQLDEGGLDPCLVVG